MGALHCSSPLAWDESLAQLAEGRAETCPAANQLSSALNENSALNDSHRVDVETLFETWYDSQAPNYACLYDSAVGPCDGGFRYRRQGNTTDCIADTPTTRVREFTQLLWQSHDV